MSAKQPVSASGNRCLVPWSVDALIPFSMLLVLESMRLYKKCDTEVIATIKKNSHHKFDNAITTKN